MNICQPEKLLHWMMNLVLLLAPLTMLAIIESICTITDVSFVEWEENQGLAVFDIDDTLTILNEPAFHRPNFKLHHAENFARIMEPLSTEERLLAFTLPLLTTAGDLLEIQTPQVIRNLQSKGVKTIALTAAMGGRIRDAFIEDRRISELNRVGIDFAPSFPDVQGTIFFTNFQAPIFGSYPLFKSGILFTNENDKGDVLVEFLKALSWTPRQIIFVDDRIDHLYAVEKALSLFNPEIQFKGFHFLTDPTCYQAIDAENFREKWIEHA